MAANSRARSAHRRRQRMRHRGLITLLMSPFLIGFVLFTLYPMVASLYYSFSNYELGSTPHWAGLFNYRLLLFHDQFFWQSVRNTLWIVAFMVPLRILFALGTAMLLTRPVRGVGLYRTLFYLPTMAPPVAAALAFVYLLNPDYGPVDNLLGFLHLPQPLWFLDPSWAKVGLLLVAVWGVGDAMIIFLAGLLDVPKSLYEAAAIEGASPWQRFRFVTLPMLSPVIFFSLVIGTINGLQYFTEAYVASSNAVTASVGDTSTQATGNPQGSLLFFPTRLYNEFNVGDHVGTASAMAWMLFIVTMVLVLILLRTSRRWVHYQGGIR